MKLIINADDFGLSKALNYGIIKAHQEGVVTSTTALVNGYAFEDCLLLSEQSPLLSVGIHLNITMFKALSGVSSLTDENGYFINKSNYTNEFSRSLDDLEKEYTMQIEHFIKVMKKKPTHIDSHHHIHLLPQIKPIVEKLALKYGLIVRGYGKIKLDMDFYGDQLSSTF
ncbi:MAG: ChbG/HpnK family deacetylase, partial [Bacilli bacterium]